ncbi:MAG: MBL fold metallo-hydrolase [Dehalococcoidia bacterium]|nr:MBL fold metallo-hydrolase [Dehalococcoidia bacterium]
MQVSPSVRAVQVPDDDPMHPQMTSIYIVGHDQVFTIDSGEALERYGWMLRGYLAAMERAEIALAGITHHHSDHSGNLKFIHEEFKAEIVVPKKGVPLLKGRLPGKDYRTFDDEQVLDLGKGVRVQVLMTPGHSVDSVCYYIEEEGVLFTGDTLLGSSTTTVHNLGDYRRTLKRLLELPNLKVICPGHGPLVHDPRERLQQYIDHRDMRERQILGALKGGGAMSSWDIMLRLYPDIDTRLRRAADNNVRVHLEQLEEEGRLKTYPGRPRKPSKARQQRQEEHARIRRQVIKQADRYRAEELRAIRRTQENPPTDEWIEPPRYELA